MNLDNTAILNIRDVDYCYFINRIGKREAENLLQNADLMLQKAEYYRV